LKEDIEMQEVLKRQGELGLIPVVAIDRAQDAIQLGETLLEAGLPCAEITFRTAAAGDAIERIATNCPEILIGAGTVLTREQAEHAVGAGARFIVSPGFDAGIVDWCLEQEIAVTPGVATPTEINMALQKGLSILKFFPAEALGGISTLKAIGGPYGNVKFIPTGGVNAVNLADYLRLPIVHACGGSWVVARKLIAESRFEEIKKRVGEAREIVEKVRREDLE
jgi:2-dehydro-3-deoxyphosphogluconate aldolase/(4S)-4-hydroxy-2-oxoglutarate aldolase